jgi:type I restriction enzyme S subunit
MAREWTETTLGDAATLQRGFDLPIQKRKPGKVPIVSSSGISDYHSEPAVRAPGVVTGRYGTIGRVFLVTEDYWPLNTTLWVKDFHGNDPRFIAYLLKTIDFHSCSDKSSVPGVNRNDLHRLPVLLPPLPEQKRIAHILGALDDKIELNRRMNATLEGISRAIFKSWFVDFDPVRQKAAGRQPVGMAAKTAALFPNSFEDSEIGEVPSGWRVALLDEVADYLNGLALQKYPAGDGTTLPVIKIAQLRKGDATDADRCNDAVPSEYVIDDGDVLFSWSGSLEVVIWCGGRGALNQHLFKVTSRSYPKWFYYLWTLHHLADFRLIAADKATTMGHIQRKHLTAARVIVPPTSCVEGMTRTMEPLLLQSIRTRKESRTLAALRDTLLPKLLSGEIRVPEAEEAVEEAIG